MTELVVSALTYQKLEAFCKRPQSGLLLYGPPGAGKEALLTWLASRLLSIPYEHVAQHAFIKKLSSEGAKSLGVEAIRELDHFLRLKVPSNQEVNRIVMICGADSLTMEAQNALLKTLEEPPAGTVFLLSATHPNALLPTVTSRLAAVPLNLPTESDLEKYFAAGGHNQTVIARMYALSGGLPGLMSALLTQADHPLVEASQHAKQLLQMSTFERLKTVEQLSKQPELFINTLTVLELMASISLRKNQSADAKTAQSWLKVMQAAHAANERARLSAQAKLNVTSFMLAIS